MEPEGQPIPNDLLLAAAEVAMARQLGVPVKLGECSGREDRYRSIMLRSPVIEPAGHPSVIIKCVTAAERKPYRSDESEPDNSVTRLGNEWAGAQFLNRLGLAPPLSPRFYGADPQNGFVALEDLGDGECLADVLQGSDPGRAESFLLTYATALGKLHTATAGREAEFMAIRRGLSPVWQPVPRLSDWLTDEIPKLKAVCESTGAVVYPGFDADTASIAQKVEDPGPFLVFTPGDTCPDNHRVLPDGMRLFDFEYCEFRHALIDMAYLRVPFPTCWCVNRLPDGMPHRLEAAYRAELAKGCTAAEDDSLFYEAITAMCGYWTTRTLTWSLPWALEGDDQQWGLSTHRQRALLRIETFAATSEQFRRLPALAATMSSLAECLRLAWPDLPEMPLYPAFRPQSAAASC